MLLFQLSFTVVSMNDYWRYYKYLKWHVHYVLEARMAWRTLTKSAVYKGYYERTVVQDSYERLYCKDSYDTSFISDSMRFAVIVLM